MRYPMICILTLISAGLCWNCAKQDAPKRPNVVLVITDDQGYGDLACHGNPIIQTPNIDRLYAESVRLSNFHVGPTCSPTRAALQTGRYCNRTGVWHTIMGRSLLRRDETTLGDVFSKNEYATGMFGKWHLGDNYPFRPHDRGYQESLNHWGGGIGNTGDYWLNGYFDDSYFRNNVPEQQTGYCTDVWFDAAIDFIRRHSNEPFFCYLATNAPHGPYNVPASYVRMYRDNPDVPNANFYGMITKIDENMARLRDALEAMELADNTIFIYMTDNGTAAGYRKDIGFNAGMRGAKGSEYDGGHRVPFFIRWPAGGLGGGRDVERLTAHVDILPTLIDLCGLQPPSGVQFDGRSIKPLLYSDSEGWPDRVLITDSQRLERPEKWRQSAVMTDRWRLVNGRELYDIQADPGQEQDIAGQNGTVVEQLRNEYETWWTSVAARFDEYCPIVVGSDHENPARLSSHDWHGTENVPWNQGMVRRGIRSSGYWMIEVERAGEYAITLRRWPVESGLPLDAAAPGETRPQDGRLYDTEGWSRNYGFMDTGYIPGEAITLKEAWLTVGDQEQHQQVKPGEESVVFRMPLEAGEMQLQAWFKDMQGLDLGAYYVYVERIE